MIFNLCHRMKKNKENYKKLYLIAKYQLDKLNDAEVIKMVSYKWCKEEVPEWINIKQVYGVVFDNDGKAVLRVDDDKYKLTGGKPEKTDGSLEKTLQREYLEELNITIEEAYYLGYLLVEEDGEQYAQVRMIARIKEIGNNRPDPDNGKIYKRFMAKQENVKQYLNYADLAGNQMIDDAMKLANKKYKFDTTRNTDEYFIED